MNKLLFTFMLIVALTMPLSMYVKSAIALEETRDFNGVNYVSLKQMSKKYNLAYEEKDGTITLLGESVNLSVPLAHNVFTLNGEHYTAQSTPEVSKDEQVWISALDWAEMFNLSLTNYDQVSTMAPTSTPAVTHDSELDDNTYRVSEKWGDRVPESVRKHGNITKIVTPVFEVTPFKKEHYNEWKQDKVQGGAE